LREALRVEKQRAKEQWKWNCDHIAEQGAIISTKDEIAELKRQLTIRFHTPSEQSCTPSHDDDSHIDYFPEYLGGLLPQRQGVGRHPL